MKFKHFQSNSVKLNDASKGLVSGYASQFMNVDSYGDRIFPEAYEKTLKNRDRPVRMRWNHYGDIIGKWTDLNTDDFGLFVDGGLTPRHSKAEDVKASIEFQAIDGMSIGYHEKRVEKNKYGGVDIIEMELIEISIVEEPANLGASITSIKAIEELDNIKEIERYLRDGLGLSQKAAMTLISRIKSRRDGDVIDCSELNLNL